MILRTLGRSAAMIAAAVAALALASQASLPIGPVPITAQSLAVVLAGALLGWRGVAAVLLWLALAACGAPLLAGGTGGLVRFAGPSAGFLFAFPLAAALAAWLVRRGWDARLGWAMLLALAAHGVCLGLGLGGAWLAAAIGPANALNAGVLPFLPGALAKSLLAGAAIRWVSRRGYASASAGRAGWASPPAAPAPGRRSAPAPRA